MVLYRLSMTRQSEFCVFYVLILQMTHHAHAECMQYYSILEMEPPGWINFKTLKDVLDTGYPFNTTEEYSILQNNINCVLELNCFDSSTRCENEMHVVKLKSRHEFIPPEVTDETVAPTQSFTEITQPTDLEENMEVTLAPSPEKTTEITTVEDPEINTDVTPTVETSVSAEVSPNTTIYSTSHPLAADTTTAKGNETSSYNTEYLLEVEKKKERIKIASLVVGGLAGGILLVFLGKKILTMVQSGTYRIPDPAVADTTL